MWITTAAGFTEGRNPWESDRSSLVWFVSVTGIEDGGKVGRPRGTVLEHPDDGRLEPAHTLDELGVLCLQLRSDVR